MPEVHLPLSGLLSTGQPVCIVALPSHCLTQIAGWNGVEAARDLLASLDLPFPADYRTGTGTGTGAWRVWRIAPDRLLIRSARPLAPVTDPALVGLDLSDARVPLAIEGPGAADLLARVTSLDYAPKAFDVGTFAQTALHHVGVLIERSGLDRFEILVPTSWLQSVVDLMAENLGPARDARL